MPRDRRDTAGVLTPRAAEAHRGARREGKEWDFGWSLLVWSPGSPIFFRAGDSRYELIPNIVSARFRVCKRKVEIEGDGDVR